MKHSFILAGLAATKTLAHPGMDRVLSEIQARDDVLLEGTSTDLIGDLQDGALTPVGELIKSILQGASAIADDATYTTADSLGTETCKKDTCCVWVHVVNEMKNIFQDSQGCTDLARAAIRQGFHDAATWDKHSGYGGADGSLLLSDELSRPDNSGLAEIGAQTMLWYNKYKKYGTSMADIIQLGALSAVVSCPGGPRIKAFVGRKDNSRAGPTGRLPNPFQDAKSLIDMFAAKTFTASDLIALVGAHTASRQRFVDPTRARTPQDSTPAKWDTKYYSETLQSHNNSILVFPSDRNLATYSSTKAQWNKFAGSGGQKAWNPFAFSNCVGTVLTPLRGASTTIELYGLPPHISNVPEIWPVWEAGQARIVLLGLLMHYLYWTRQYAVCDTLIKGVAWLGINDFMVVWNHGDTTWALVRLFGSFAFASTGYIGLTQGPSRGRKVR